MKENPTSFKATANRVVGRLWRLPPELPIFGFFLLVTFFLTWPLVVRFTGSIYGIPSDNLGIIWQMWWARNATGLGASASFCPLIGFPFGTAFGFCRMEPLAALTERFLLLFASEIVVYNLLTLSGFFLSGVTMYYLVRYLTGDRRVAFFGGFAYMITGWHAYQALFYNRLAAIQWIPLYILMLLKFIKKPSVKTAVLLWLSALLVAGMSIHFGLFMVIFTAAFLAGRLAHKRISERLRRRREGIEGKAPWELNRKTLLLSLAVVLALMVVLAPFAYEGLFSGQASDQEWSKTPIAGELRTETEYVQNSARPLDYLWPDPYNPFLGRITRKFGPDMFRGFNESLNVGWVLLALAVLGMVFMTRRTGGARTGGENRHIAWGFLVAALVCFVFSLRPFISIGGVRIPLPSTLLSIFAPLFRWYLRLGIVVILCSIVLACLGLSTLLDKVKRSRRAILLVVLTAILAMESIIVPPFRTFDTKQTPLLFEKLASVKDGAAVAFYPLQEAGTFPTSALLFYQRQSKAPMLNAAGSSTDGETLRRTVYNPYNQATPGILSRFDIDYLAYYRINENYYGRTELWDFDPNRIAQGLELEGAYRESGMFDETYLFRVTAPPAELVPLYLGDFTVPRLIDDKSARFALKEGVIRILNFTGAGVAATLRLPIRNLEHPREVTIECDGIVLWKSTLEGGEETTAVIDDLLIPPEGVDLELKVEGPVLILRELDARLFGAKAASVMTGDLETTMKEK
ncbi:MAG: hypothetical protein KKE90_09550 [Actinobacteria bacterium]|nr:hypothetical protein [Actinomycetota bacterium]MBU4359483.1 hypothetical protein [Actinomycetota bacterium]MCG2819990.1 hypothetical protein [Actinomycetes bacterium]